MPTLTFNEEKHEYAVDGFPVLGVSRILHAAGLIDSTWVREEGLKRGSFIHSAVELHLQGKLDEADLDPRLKGYVDAFKKAQAELLFEVVNGSDGVPCIERRVFHPTLGYAGTVDMVVRRGDAPPIVVDLKSGEPDDWHGWQLALYALTFTDRVQRANLYVRADGTYRWIERKDRADFEVVKAALTVAQVRIKKGLAA